MSRAIDILLGEILEAIELVQRYTEGLSIFVPLHGRRGSPYLILVSWRQ